MSKKPKANRKKPAKPAPPGGRGKQTDPNQFAKWLTEQTKITSRGSFSGNKLFAKPSLVADVPAPSFLPAARRLPTTDWIIALLFSKFLDRLAR